MRINDVVVNDQIAECFCYAHFTKPTEIAAVIYSVDIDYKYFNNLITIKKIIGRIT
jgi:hypothetical protein